MKLKDVAPIDPIKLYPDFKLALLYTQKKEDHLWRGLQHSSLHGYEIDSPSEKHAKHGDRQSKGTSPWLWEMVRQFPAWKNVPDRRKSIFFTANRGIAREWGQTVAIFPKNDAKIAVANGDWNLSIANAWPHFAETLTYRDSTIEDAGDHIKYLMRMIIQPIITGEYDWFREQYVLNLKATTKHYKAEIKGVTRKSLSNVIGYYLEENMFDEFMALSKQHKHDLYAMFEDLLDFNNNKFRIVNTIQAVSMTGQNAGVKEFWTEADCLIVPPAIAKRDLIKD